MVANLHRMWLGMFLTCAAISAQAQPQRATSDQQIIQQAQRVERGELLDIYQHGIDIEETKFLHIAEDGYRGIERVTGLKLDTKTYGPKIWIVVSASVRMPHVWKGSEHAQEPRPIVFLTPMAYRGALQQTNSTYIHEMTHLFTWRYRSHTLHEGFADYVALTVLPNTAVGPNPNGYETNRRIPSDMAEYLGTTKPPPDWLHTDAERRTAYYLASYRFVKHLIAAKGLSTFMQLYNAASPETAFVTIYDVKREAAIRAAGL